MAVNAVEFVRKIRDENAKALKNKTFSEQVKHYRQQGSVLKKRLQQAQRHQAVTSPK